MAAVISAVQMSGYITAMAASARVAQSLLSSGPDPMTIKEFKFDVNLSTDFDIQSQTDVTLKIWRLSITEKITVDYKNHWGLTISCTIVPTVTI